MLIATIIIALLILLINIFTGYSLYKSNKNYIYCIFLSLAISIVYISVGAYLYNKYYFFPMVFMLICSMVCGGIYARANPKVEVKHDNSTYETTFITKYDVPVIYIKILIVSIIFISITFFLAFRKGSGLSQEELTHRQNLISICKEMIKEKVVIKSSLDTHDIIGTSYYQAPANGNEVITMDFDASNAYGIKSKYKARCLFPKGELPEINIVER